MCWSALERVAMRVLLDTDVGGDVDDANALDLLVGLPDVELVAVTTVGAGVDAVKCGRLASYILPLAGRPDVPVHAGIDRPMVSTPKLEARAADMILNWIPSEPGRYVAARAGALIGGTSLFGGSGTARGALIGAFAV
jgi:inosine-uridine nucleoside N-ribohydrolase